MNKENIVQWLDKQGDDIVKRYDEGKGFHVRMSAKVQKPGEEPVNVNQALEEAGFRDGDEVGGYAVRRKDFDDGRFCFKFFATRPVTVVDDCPLW